MKKFVAGLILGCSLSFLAYAHGQFSIRTDRTEDQAMMYAWVKKLDPSVEAKIRAIIREELTRIWQP